MLCVCEVLNSLLDHKRCTQVKQLKLQCTLSKTKAVLACVAMTELNLGPKVAFPKGEDSARVFPCMFWGVVLTSGSNFQCGVLVQRLTLCTELLYLVAISVSGRCLGNICAVIFVDCCQS